MTPFPRDLAEFLGMKSEPRRTTIDAPKPESPVKVTKEGALWSVYVHGQEAGWVDKSALLKGYRALTKRGTVAHCHSLDSAVNFLVESYH
jgi:hypothetical protein